MIKIFEDLEVWQIARMLVKEVYEITQKAEFQKDFGLKDQVRRCAIYIQNQTITISKSLSGFIKYLSNSTIIK